MKMTQDDYQALKALIMDEIQTMGYMGIVGEKGIKLYYIAEVEVGKRSQKKVRWDILWALDPVKRTPLMDRFYKYLDDSHIDTALKSILNPIFKAE